MSETIELNVEQICAELRIRREIYIKLVKSFVNSLTGKMHSLTDALANNNRDQMRMVLHEIKGTAANLRLKNILGPEGLMHEAVKAGEAQGIIAQHFELLKAEVVRLQQYVYQTFGETP